MRYDTKNIKRLDNGKRVLKTTIPKSIPKRDDDIYVITQETDRLDLLANEYYGDSRLWWVIAQANNINGVNIGLDAGVQLRIPKNKFDVINNI
jgi:nucleoid-associated protein YgaU